MIDPYHFNTEYFPSIKTLAAALKYRDLVLETSENFQKNSCRNRCYLTGAQGKFFITVPLKKGKHQQLPIQKVEISYDFDWVSHHLKTISNSYIKSPFFLYFMDDLTSILRKKEKYLIDLNWALLSYFLEKLKVTPHLSCNLDFKHSHSENADSILRPYPQLYEDKTGFIPDLSALDLFFCMGPNRKYLE